MKEGGIINLGAPKEYEPSEWMIDENGRKYRMIGSCCKEYEMMVRIDGIEIPQSEVPEYHRRKRERELQEKAKDTNERDTTTERICPFKKGQRCLKVSCETSCVFYGESSCVLADLSRPATKDTKGMNCIIGMNCNELCAMYNNGCTLPNTIKSIIERSK